MNDDATSLGHDEIWDDSVLIESWNEALEEYKVTMPDLAPCYNSSHSATFRNTTAFWQTVATSRTFRTPHLASTFDLL